MSQDFEALPIGTEAALREMIRVIDNPVPGHEEESAVDSIRAILAQIDAQRKGATDAG